MMYEKITTRRTIRKFLQKDVSRGVLLKCVDAARLSPSAGNRQPLRYVLVNDKGLLKAVFGTLSFAGSLPEYQPGEDEMPTAYIVILLDTKIRDAPGHDAGIAAMSISMVAHDEGLGACMLGAVDRKAVRKILKVPTHLKIVLLVALGYPAEQPVADKVKDGKTRYWLDQRGVLHVPKRALEDIARWNGY